MQFSAKQDGLFEENTVLATGKRASADFGAQITDARVGQQACLPDPPASRLDGGTGLAECGIVLFGDSLQLLKRVAGLRSSLLGSGRCGRGRQQEQQQPVRNSVHDGLPACTMRSNSSGGRTRTSVIMPCKNPLHPGGRPRVSGRATASSMAICGPFM